MGGSALDGAQSAPGRRRDIAARVRRSGTTATHPAELRAGRKRRVGAINRPWPTHMDGGRPAEGGRVACRSRRSKVTRAEQRCRKRSENDGQNPEGRQRLGLACKTNVGADRFHVPINRASVPFRCPPFADRRQHLRAAARPRVRRASGPSTSEGCWLPLAAARARRVRSRRAFRGIASKHAFTADRRWLDVDLGVEIRAFR